MLRDPLQSPPMFPKSLVFLLVPLLFGARTPEEAPLSLLVTSPDSGLLLIVDAESGQVEATIRVGDGPTDVAVSESGDRAVVANSGRTAAGSSLSLVNTTTRQGGIDAWGADILQAESGRIPAGQPANCGRRGSLQMFGVYRR